MGNIPKMILIKEKSCQIGIKKDQENVVPGRVVAGAD